jgi:beta-N-acetylhexosaminidase
MHFSQTPGPVMFDLRSTQIEHDEIEKLRHPRAGGIIFFTRNFENIEQIADLTAAIRAVRKDILIAVDHEGGRVQRFREGFSRIPAAAKYAMLGTDDQDQQAELMGWLMAMELRAVDIDFSFAPVLDVDSGISEVIGDRSFARDPAVATRLALAFRRGMARAGMASVGKHFPGHGGVALDSHLALPIDTRDFSEILARDLVPFKALIDDGLEGIMPAHVVYAKVDDHPAGFSRHWIQTVLRGELSYDGAVFSDDLSMAGAKFAGDHKQRAEYALEAGCDMVLVCNQSDVVGDVLESLEAYVPSKRPDRLLRMKGRFPVDRKSMIESPQWQFAHTQALQYS